MNSKAHAARLAINEERLARMAFTQESARVESLKRDLTSQMWSDRGRRLDDKTRIARELQTALNAKALAEKDMRSAQRVRKSLAGGGTRQSSVVWL